jgi:hypothetical protein
MGNRTKTETEMLGEMEQAVAGTSPRGSRIRRIWMVLQVRETATAMEIDFLTAEGVGETRNVMIGETEEEIVVTEDGTEIEINGKSASQSGWMSQPRIKLKVTHKKTFRSGGKCSIRRTKLARHLLRMWPSQMPVLLSSALTRRWKRLWRLSKLDQTSS